MDVQKADLLRGLSSDCINEIMDFAVQESYGKGTYIFLKKVINIFNTFRILFLLDNRRSPWKYSSKYT